jgi:hypothetical protein
MQFSLKRFFVAVTLISVGIGRLVLNPVTELGMAFWLLSGPLIGAGAISLYKRSLAAAAVGAVLGEVAQLVIVGLIIRDWP